MYITSWDEFQKVAEDIYTNNPETTRYVHSFHRNEGDLVLKVTDDRNIVKYKTNQMKDLKKFITLNLSLVSKMSKKEITEETMMREAVPVKSKPLDNKTASPRQATRGKKTKKRK
ncbi:signal recognition particle, SRP9/SRP14 subunit [Pilobolus umbonatus]|nr:signal recognition particle, SRP9/SRP14 subunit [Pilobolus umbonatus]